MIKGVKYRSEVAINRIAYAVKGAGNFARLRGAGNRPMAQVAAVMVGRNDDYMPDFADRLRSVIVWNLRHLTDEVVFVEWNPPPDRELLSPGFAEKFPQFKGYVVPNGIHRAVCLNPNLPLMEYHAKNVGIRRANARLVIATNADVAVAADAILALKRLGINDNLAWTAQRIDIHWAEGRKKEIGLGDCVRFKRINPYTMHGTGDFLMATREFWRRVRGYDENLLKHRIGCDIRGAAQMLAHGAEIRKIGNILHLAHPTSCTEGVRPHHGEYAPLDNLPYQNSDDWGLGNCREVQISERVWRLELPN